MTQPSGQDAVIASYQQATIQVREHLAGFLLALWASLGVYRAAQMADFGAQAVPVVEGAMGHMQALTAAYLAQFASGHPGRATPYPSGTVGIRDARNGADPAEVYGRPFHLVWRELGKAQAERDAHYQWAAPTSELPERPPLPPADYVEKAIKAGSDRAVQLALTDVQLAKTHTAQNILAQDHRVVGYRRVLEGAHSCGLCIVASTVRYHKGQLLPIHPACLPGDATVSARGVVAVSRRWYSGELSIVTTAAGDQIRVTANHPVLTDRGWLPAQFIREGDRVLGGLRSDGLIDGRPHEQHRPALAEDVWRAASMAFGLVKVPLATEDFHGDAAYGEVDVVYTDGYLAPVGDVHFAKPVSERLLVPGHDWWGALNTLSVARSGLPCGLAASVGLMSRSDLSKALFRGHLAGTSEASGAPVARFDAPREQFSLQSAAAYASRGLDLVSRLAGQIEADRVVEKRGIGFTGHVYNFHTEEGWYSTSNHIVSNCDCSVAPIIGDHDPGRTIDEPTLSAAHAAIRDRFGKSSPAAGFIPGSKGAQYRDVLITHEHGELGPILAVRGQAFTGPNDL